MVNIVFTEHAKTRMAQRRITEDDVSSVINTPDIAKESFKGRIRSQKRLANRILEVVYKKSGRQVVIITCYWIKEEK